MIAAPPGRRRRLLALRSLAATLLVGAFLVPAAPLAVAAAEVQVTLTAATASGTGPTDVVTVSGTITNPGAAPVHGVRAQLWRSTAILHSPAAIENATTGADVPPGRTVAADGALVEVDATLDPGEQRSFTVVATRAEAGLRSADATYWVGATVSARATPTGATTTTEARTLVSLPDTTPARVTTLVELSASPRQVRPNLFSDDALAAELTGRLAVLLDAAARPAASYVVDPALVVEVSDMADGYSVVAGDGVVEGSGRAVARAWLDELATLPDAAGYDSLFARPDLLSARGLGDDDLVPELLAASADPDAGRPLLVVVDAVDTATLEALQPLDAPVVALDTGVAGVWARAAGTPLLSAVRPARPLAGRALVDTPLNRAAALAASARAAGVQLRLVRNEADVAADRSAEPTWITRRSLADLMADDPAPWSRAVTAGPHPADVLADDGLAGLRALGDGLRAYAAAAPASGVADLVDRHLARAASESWAGDPEGRAAWLAAVDTRVGLAALGRGVSLSALPRFTMSSSENEFPVTVTNELADDVVLTVVAASDTPQRIRLEPSQPVTVRAGTSTGVVLRAVARANGVATATLHAESTDGRRLTGDVPVVVEATDLGAVGWVIVVVSGVVLVVTTALRIRRVRRREQGTTHG